MRKIDKVIWKETGYVALWVLILSLLMEAVFLLIKKWDYTVLTGNLLSAFVGILNFFLMGVFLTKALEKDEKTAKQATKLSQVFRMFLIFVVTVVGVLLDCFNTWAVVIPLIFPRIGIALRPLFNKRKKGATEGVATEIDSEKAPETFEEREENGENVFDDGNQTDIASVEMTEEKPEVDTED